MSVFCLGKTSLYFTPEENAVDCAGGRLALRGFTDQGGAANVGVCKRHAEMLKLRLRGDEWIYAMITAAEPKRQ